MLELPILSSLYVGLIADLAPDPAAGTVTSPLTQLERELCTARARAKLLGWGIEERKQFVREMEAGFAEAFPVGASIIVHQYSFNFVSAENGVLALKQFVEAFGGEAKGWAFGIGRPMMMGAVFGRNEGPCRPHGPTRVASASQRDGR